MSVKVAINGFGRIGRLVLRAALGNPEVEVVSVNDITSVETNAHLLKYDSVHGTLDADVKVEGGDLIVNGKRIKVTAEKDPAVLPHKATGATIVVESTGKFTKKADASKHIAAGASKVVISAPSEDPDYMVVLGVNCAGLPKSAQVVSNASCTTNCLAPLVKALHDKFGVEKGLVTTIHSYTNDQNLLDLAHKDLRRARAAALSMIPSKTGAAAAIGRVIPDLAGKLDGLAIRVPTPNVSLVDFVGELKTPADKAAVNAHLKAASESGPLSRYMKYSDLPLVSTDYNHDPASSIIDSKCTYVVGNMVKVMAWYDNEWGYSNRCIDLILMLAK